MFEYMTAQEAAEKWNVSLRWVQRLCKENRIEGARNFNRVWLTKKMMGMSASVSLWICNFLKNRNFIRRGSWLKK